MAQTEEIVRIEHGVRINTDRRGANYVETGRHYFVVVCSTDDVIENEDFDTEADRDAFIATWSARYPGAEIARIHKPLTLI